MERPLPVTALGSRILVKLHEENEEKKNSFGIILPATSEEQKKRQGNLGTVLDVGPDVSETHKKELRPGDWVIFNKWAGTEVSVEEESFLLVKGEEVIGRLNNVN